MAGMGRVEIESGILVDRPRVHCTILRLRRISPDASKPSLARRTISRDIFHIVHTEVKFSLRGPHYSNQNRITEEGRFGSFAPDGGMWRKTRVVPVTRNLSGAILSSRGGHCRSRVVRLMCTISTLSGESLYTVSPEMNTIMHGRRRRQVSGFFSSECVSISIITKRLS